MEGTEYDVAAEIRVTLARQRRTASSLALQLGWGQKYLSRRLTGEVPFNVNEVAQIALALNVPVTSFFAVQPARQLAEVQGVSQLRKQLLGVAA